MLSEGKRQNQLVKHTFMGLVSSGQKLFLQILNIWVCTFQWCNWFSISLGSDTFILKFMVHKEAESLMWWYYALEMLKYQLLSVPLSVAIWAQVHALCSSFKVLNECYGVLTNQNIPSYMCVCTTTNCRLCMTIFLDITHTGNGQNNGNTRQNRNEIVLAALKEH
jgi:hypothetical protein